MELKTKILSAAKATDIPAGESGQWYIFKDTVGPNGALYRLDKELIQVPPGTYTHLLRWTQANIHLPHGECVMEDTPREINKHLQFMLLARGKVLITGLGLGCVTRGTLANPAVTSVTVIEQSPDVLKLVRPYMPNDPRLTIIESEAEAWIENNSERFDCAWHDLWTNTAEGEDHLQIKHASLINKLSDNVNIQGAWAMPRWYRRIVPDLL